MHDGLTTARIAAASAARGGDAAGAAAGAASVATLAAEAGGLARPADEIIWAAGFVVVGAWTAWQKATQVLAAA